LFIGDRYFRLDGNNFLILVSGGMKINVLKSWMIDGLFLENFCGDLFVGLLVSHWILIWVCWFFYYNFGIISNECFFFFFDGG
jgi:hypothetical protein